MTFEPASQFLRQTLAEGAQSVTVACVSALTNEEGGIVVTPKTTLDDIVRAYALQFPLECKAYLLKVKETNAQLVHSNAMTAGKTMMKLTEIPEFIMWATRAIRRDYWEDKARIYSFIRQFPAFMVGDHSKKETKGVIIK